MQKLLMKLDLYIILYTKNYQNGASTGLKMYQTWIHIIHWINIIYYYTYNTLKNNIAEYLTILFYKGIFNDMIPLIKIK